MTTEPKVYQMSELQVQLWTNWDEKGTYPCPYTKSGKWMDIIRDAQKEENNPGYSKVPVEHGWE